MHKFLSHFDLITVLGASELPRGVLAQVVNSFVLCRTMKYLDFAAITKFLGVFRKDQA